MKTLLNVLFTMLLIFLPGSVQAQEGQEDYARYEGKIGPYAITLFLDMHADYEEAGYYYYNDRPKTKFKLKMVSNEPNPKGFNRVVLYEYSPKGNHTGTFQGIVEGRGDGFYGTFTNGQGKKFKFELMHKYDTEY